MSADTAPASAPQRANAWLAGGAALVAVACVTRVVNALRYRTASGFDAAENIEYIGLLTHSWALPAPDAAWSTSHPPFFYYVGALIAKGLGWLGLGQSLLQALPLMASLASILTAMLAGALVLRVDPGNYRRALIATGLLLFLPVHIYMSAMVNEETLAALLVSLALYGGITHAERMKPRDSGGAVPTLAAAAGVGVIAGLAFLTKLSGCLVAAAIAGGWLLGAFERKDWRSVVPHVIVFSLCMAVVGGWFYARNLLEYGYLYPQDLSLHAVMFEMPPGERGLLDYLRIPLATWTDPQLLNPDLLHSVWGSTYATVYFDGHRHFLPYSVAATRWGSGLLVLGALPFAAWLIGLWRGARRSLAGGAGADAAMIVLVALSLAGYVAFTWGNPWFATLKGGYLLGLSLPFAFYASELLAEWTALDGVRGWLAWGILGLLAAAVSLTFTIGVLFTKLDGPGLPWRALVGAG